MQKTLTETKIEIINAQEKERMYKGAINRALYIVCVDTLGKPSRRTPWKFMDKNTFNSILNNSIADQLITRVFVTNGYSDWEVNVLVK